MSVPAGIAAVVIAGNVFGGTSALRATVATWIFFPL